MDETSTKRTCSFFGCTNVFNKNTELDEITFHAFPRNPFRKQIWSECCKIINFSSKGYKVCSDHFEPSQYKKHLNEKGKGKRGLEWNARPTIPPHKKTLKQRLNGENIYPMVDDWGPELCRLCAQPINLYEVDNNPAKTGIHIFGAEGQKLELCKKINMYLSHPVQLEDSLPKFTCKLCIKRLIDTVSTVEAFRNADALLRDELYTKGTLKNLEATGHHGIFTSSSHRYQCTNCERIFSDNNELFRHELEHLKSDSSDVLIPLPNEPTPIANLQTSCPECGLKFLSHRTLVTHQMYYHKNLLTLEQTYDQLLNSLETDAKDFEFENPRDNMAYRYDLLAQLCESEGNSPIPSPKQSPKKLIKASSTNKLKSIIKPSVKIKNQQEKKQTSEPIQIIAISTGTKKDNISSETNEMIEEYVKKELEVKFKLCQHCENIFTPSGLKTHLAKLKNKNDEKEFICDMCKKTFKERHLLVMHIKNTHNLKRLPCTECPRTFKSKEGLQGHLMAHAGIYRFLCDICGQSFLTQSSLRIHRRKHTKQNFFTCEHCGKMLQEHNRFQDHLRTHTGETPFGCDKCDRKFHSKKILKQHMQIHNDKRPFKCDKCNLSFKRVGNLKQHMERHATYQPICSICRAKFNSCEERNEHRRNHTKEERDQVRMARKQPPKGPKRIRDQYLCKGCSTVFTTKEEKEKHLTENPTHAKSIKCDMCEHTFRSYQSLFVHQRIHTGERPYSCTVCYKTFRTYATCRQHTLVHSAEANKFKCDQCERSFNRLSTLNVHKRSHSNERPYECPTCGRAFKQKQDMKRHLRLHGGVKQEDVRASKIHETHKWGLVMEEELNAPHPTLCDAISIPADMHDLQYGQSSLLATNNIVITVPYVNSSTDPQAFFSM